MSILVKYIMVAPGPRARTGYAAGPRDSAGCSAPWDFQPSRSSWVRPASGVKYYIHQGLAGKTETTRGISRKKAYYKLLVNELLENLEKLKGETEDSNSRKQLIPLRLEEQRKMLMLLEHRGLP